ncbi:MAG: hypothetical protein QG671_1944 [Actinomycetota bacterium]|nr:hypothetical protein [Actinomycetota bacterium]
MTVPEAAEPDDTLDDLDLDRLIPLGVLAAELDTTVAELARRLGPDAVFLDGIGLRCTTEAQAAAVITERDARLARERQRRREAQRQPALDAEALRRRVKAIAERQHQIDVGDDLDLATSALATVTAAEHSERIKRSSSNLDDFMSGDLTYHRLSDNQE